MDVTVTIANWNRADLLERCLRSVLVSHGLPKVEIIVVDNASGDDSAAMVRQLFPSVRLIVNAENRGFGCAHNQAIAMARGRYVLVLNNDAAVMPDTIATLVEFMDQHPRAGICTCPAKTHDGSAWGTGGGIMHFPSVTSEAVAGILELTVPPFGWGTSRFASLAQKVSGYCDPSRLKEVAWARGGLLLMRMQMLEQIGVFDERFFLFFEETDLCLRARKPGWTIWQTPATAYIHDARQSTALRSDRPQINSVSGFAYFLKHYGRLRAILWRGQDLLIHRSLLGLRRRVGQAFRNRFRRSSLQHCA